MTSSITDQDARNHHLYVEGKGQSLIAEGKLAGMPAITAKGITAAVSQDWLTSGPHRRRSPLCGPFIANLGINRKESEMNTKEKRTWRRKSEMNQQAKNSECNVGTASSQTWTPRDQIKRDQIKRDAEVCLKSAHDLDSGLGLDEEKTCETELVLKLCIRSLDYAIDDYGLFYMLPILREKERDWLREHAALPRGGFGQMLTYEDSHGVHQSRESDTQWKLASAIETMPRAIRENLTHLGMAIHNGHATLDHLYWLIDALIKGDDDTKSPE